jgi:hypothetical protein
MLAFIVYAASLVFNPYVALEDAYEGPGHYYWRVEFSPSHVVQSGFYLREAPGDWQLLYDEQWRIVAPFASEWGFDVPHDGCWLKHDCPPAMIHYAEVEREIRSAADVVEAATGFLSALLRWR